MREPYVPPIDEMSVVVDFDHAQVCGGLFMHDGKIRKYLKPGLYTGIYDNEHQYLLPAITRGK